MPSSKFDPQSRLFKTKEWEMQGTLYTKFFAIKKWKSKLPDAAAWFAGGFPKKKILHRDPKYLKEFVVETCRGEGAHWATMLCCPIFFIWNPAWASTVMFIYALAANLPCILTQRYNRIVLQRLITKSQNPRQSRGL
jgi:glycosyl-4,4'-diaponeurosporenoate acyltransferase